MITQRGYLDACPKGLSNWVSNTSTDYDSDGCADLSEDYDDDNDGVMDVINTGSILDACPKTPINVSISTKMVVLQLGQR